MLEHITMYIKEIPRIAKRTMQTVKNTTRKAGHYKLLQNIKDSYKKATLAITIVTSMTDRTNHMKQPHTLGRKMQILPGMRKLNNEYDRSYQSHTARTCNNNSN